MMVSVIPAISTVSASGFEDDDGNLDLDGGTGGGDFDWNEFAPVTWSAPGPNQTATDLEDGWSFDGNEDRQASALDDAFAGGTKQDNECPSVITQKANNKTDLKRIYLASKIINGNVFLMLAWSRIPQNTTSPSANVAFEFNRGETLCGGTAGAAGLVERSLDTDPDPDVDNSDLLVVYDFLGGSDAPTISIARWVGSGSCEVGSSTPPCWGPYQQLSSPTSEALVNTFGPVDDDIGPAGAGESLGTKEFGEAGINLTDAGVFPEAGCVTFGQNYAVSRTSGNAATAQMKDLVGTDFLLTNCGSLKIVKTDEDDNPLAGAKFKVYKDDGDGAFEPGTGDVQVGDECTTTADGTGDCVFSDLVIGDKFWVLETQAPPGYEITGTNPQLVEITDASQHVVTFTDAPALGDVKVVKKDDAGNLLAGVTFTLKGTSTIGNAVDLSCTTGDGVSSGSNSDGTTPANAGECSFLNVEVGTYTLDEDDSSLPPGYDDDPSFPKQVTVIGGQTVTVNATNPRLHKVIVIVCHQGTNTLLATDVVNGSSTKTSIGTAPAGITQAQLCALGGASFGNLGHTDKSLTVKLGNFDDDHLP
jgi:hypothetical protein